MNVSRFLLLSFLSLALGYASPALFAQGSVAPDGQFGLTVDNGGFGIAYAFSPSLQFHTGFGVSLGDSPTTIFVAPSLKFLFEGPINPYLIGGVQYASVEGQDDADMFVRVGAGIDYYFNEHLGIYGHVTLFRYQASPEPTTVDFGVAVDGDGRIGVEWFF